MMVALQGVLNNSAMVEALKDDPEIASQMQTLALMAIQEADSLLRNGPPNVKVQVLRAIMPAVASALKASTVDNELEQFKDEMRQMMKEVRGGDEDEDSEED